MSNYFINLSADIQHRYVQKIAAIDGYDPYTLNETNFAEEIEDFPKISLVDIVTYYAFTHNFYTSEQVKAFKSLEAYKFYESGFIEEMNFVKFSENFLVIALVKHTQRMNEPSLKPWLIFSSTGSILSGHCTCMAGLGEVCSHTGAIAFSLFQHSVEELACTDKLCVWKVPKTRKFIVAKKLKEIDLGKQSTSYNDIYSQKISPLSGERLLDFYKRLEMTVPNAVIFSVTEPFASERKITDNTNLPPVLTDLYDEKYNSESLETLQNIQLDLKLTEDQIKAVYYETVNQSGGEKWFKFRNGRITASNFYKACKTNLTKPSLSLIKSICYSTKVNLKVASIQWGQKHEKDALKVYSDNMKLLHTNLQINKYGLIISEEFPVLGASPDAIVLCDCCGQGCVEIKCPHTLRDPSVNFDDWILSTKFCLKKDVDNKLYMDPTHQYYYQVQLQMFCTETEYCDFVVWSESFTQRVRVFINWDFLVENVNKARSFHQNVIVPELLCRYFTSPKEAVLHLIEQENCYQNYLEDMDVE